MECNCQYLTTVRPGEKKDVTDICCSCLSVGGQVHLSPVRLSSYHDVTMVICFVLIESVVGLPGVKIALLDLSESHTRAASWDTIREALLAVSLPNKQYLATSIFDLQPQCQTQLQTTPSPSLLLLVVVMTFTINHPAMSPPTVPQAAKANPFILLPKTQRT